jgi:hypothetical protein
VNLWIGWRLRGRLFGVCPVWSMIWFVWRERSLTLASNMVDMDMDKDMDKDMIVTVYS